MGYFMDKQKYKVVIPVPLTYQHIEKLKNLYGVYIDTVCMGTLAEIQGGFEVWYGMRSEESHEREKRYRFNISNDLYEPHEVMPTKYPKYLGKMGIKFKLPVLDWSTKEIFDFLDGEHNPLYNE